MSLLEVVSRPIEILLWDFDIETSEHFYEIEPYVFQALALRVHEIPDNGFLHLRRWFDFHSMYPDGLPSEVLPPNREISASLAAFFQLPPAVLPPVDPKTAICFLASRLVHVYGERYTSEGPFGELKSSLRPRMEELLQGDNPFEAIPYGWFLSVFESEEEIADTVAFLGGTTRDGVDRGDLKDRATAAVLSLSVIGPPAKFAEVAVMAFQDYLQRTGNRLLQTVSEAVKRISAYPDPPGFDR